ncbi:KAP family NTPase [Vibrio chagasii]|uniref:KAP family NTPase n=1 Tax=Vibrio chagasii TaxID=170679 RepID=UPI001EFE3254|nr:KAP family NTPase [Vibrio chagasii]MCG9563530.1 KAP family NTPase [Vibrio chagasii]
MENFEENVVSFLKHKEKKVLVIKGKWGVGKTFKWNEIVNKHFSSLNFSNYSYVSLFGLDGLKELQSGVFYNACTMRPDRNSSTIKSNLKKVGAIAKNIPQVTKYANAISVIENSLVDDYLICIDDLERKSEKLSMSILLGYVSNLTESSNCKVVLIFNDDTLIDKDKKEIDLYREKVIDLELEYSPNPTKNIDIEFKDHHCRDLICKIFKTEGLNNIRIIKHLKWNLDALMGFVESSEEAVRIDLLSTIAILTYVHHEPSIDIRANEIERVFSYSEKDESDKKLQKRISSLGYIYYADHESEIINYIEDGWMDRDVFVENILRLNQRQIESNISSRLKDVWGFYNNNFLSTSEDVILGLEGFLTEHLGSISVRELHPILDTLSELKDDFDKSLWIDKFVDLKLDSDDPVLLKQLKQMTTNTELIERLSLKESEINQHHSIYAVLSKIVKNRGWNPEDEEYLGNHSVDDIYEFLISDDSSDLMQVVRESTGIFSLGEGESPRDIFGRNLHQALIKLSEKSKLDRYRIVHFFGIEIDDKTED